jgi:hypothetical protein
MRLRGQVERDIYRAGKLVSAVENVLKSRVRLVLLGRTSMYYSFSEIRPVAPRPTSMYYLYYLHSMSSTIESTSGHKV